MPRLVLLLVPLLGLVALAGPGPDRRESAVVVLLDESLDRLLPQLTNDEGSQPGEAQREDLDAYTGLVAVRVQGVQKYRARIPNWSYKIVEKPTQPGEFRWVRFAWKKTAGTGVMIQFHDDTRGWVARYVAGPNTVTWQAVEVAREAPPGWSVVTRDLFQDFGSMRITGLALTAMDGESAHFDHVLLGTSMTDLDTVTDRVLGKIKPAKPLMVAERDTAWADLTHQDANRATTAFQSLLSSASDHVAFLRRQIESQTPDDQTRQIAQHIADLDADDFQTREKATQELSKLGPAATSALTAVVKTSPSAEVRFRATGLLRALGNPTGSVSPSAQRGVRAARILEQARTPEADKLLEAMTRGIYGPDWSEGAKIALRRRMNEPRTK